MEDAETYVGMTALKLVERIVEGHTEIVQWTFVRYRISQSVRGRLLNGYEPSTLADDALVRDPERYWRWMKKNLLVDREPDSAIAALLAHDGATERGGRFNLTREEILAGGLGERARKLDLDDVLGFCSRCWNTSGAERHLPLMDFNVGPGDRGRELVVSAMSHLLSYGGYLLRSGRSYHFYGSKVMTWRKYADFASACLLLEPITDPRYIAHRLLSRMGVLRLTASGGKPSVPKVVAVSRGAR